MKKLLFTILLVLASFQVNAQQSLKAHSHNDYSNVIPFWLAYYNHFSSIEADIWIEGNELYVAHDKKDIKPERTLDALYLQPVIKLVRYNGGRPWHDNAGNLQLLIDLKTAAAPTLSLLAQKLKEYPDVFDPSVNSNAVRIVISGNRPSPAEYVNYPSFIFFDGVIGGKYTEEQLLRVPLFSENMSLLIRRDANGNITKDGKARLVTIVDSIHALKKKVRFWNAPDNPDAWTILLEAGTDYVNTDHINQLADFLKKR